MTISPDMIADTTIQNLADYLGYEVFPGEWGPKDNKRPGLGLMKDGRVSLSPTSESELRRKLIRATKRKVDRGRVKNG